MDPDSDADPDPAIFVSDFQYVNHKKFSMFFAFYFLKLHFYHFSKIKSHTEVTKQSNQCFSYCFCLMIERRIRIRISDQWIRIREAEKHMDPTDPEHCLKLCVYLIAVSFAAKRALISSRRAVDAAGSGFCDALVRIRSTRSRSRSTVPVLRSSNTSCLASYRLKKVSICYNRLW